MTDTPEAAPIRAQILESVRRYHAAQWAPKPFRPGIDPVPYAGRVFDAAGIAPLVERMAATGERVVAFVASIKITPLKQ